MHTYYLGREEVEAFARDFANRIVTVAPSFPTVWCPLGQSGQEILAVILKFLPEKYKKKIRIVPLQFNRDSNKALLESARDAHMFKGKTALILDSSVHSGSTMLACVDEAIRCGVANTISYSLVVKRGASFVPNYFGLIIADYDRAYFLLKRIPTYPACCRGNLRKISSSDVRRKPAHINSGLKSLDETTWATLYYESIAKLSQVYLCTHNSSVLGFISFQIIGKHSLFIDLIAIDKASQGMKIGGALMRWAEIYARTHNCSSIELWAIKNQVGFYEHMEFRKTGEKLDLGSEKYVQMRRRLLYNIKPDMSDEYCAL